MPTPLARPLQYPPPMLAATVDSGTRRPRVTVATEPLRDCPGAPTARCALPLEGDVLDGRYRIEEIVGEGGMGVVVAARDLELGHRVAIKFLRPSACRNEDMLARFRWEARASLRISSEHVVRVKDAGALGNGAPYIVMELLEGVDLAELLRARGGTLDVGEAVDYILQVCEALAEAHAVGIVHRDLKPENVFLCRRPDGTVLIKVIDFGISSGVEITIDGSSPDRPAVKVELMGSPAYMAPEQVTDFDAVDARADVWSLGAILYELLTGSRIHDEESIGVLLAMVRYSPVESARFRRPDLPEALDHLILSCLERDRDRRVQSVSDLATALLPFAAERAQAMS